HAARRLHQLVGGGSSTRLRKKSLRCKKRPRGPTDGQLDRRHPVPHLVPALGDAGPRRLWPFIVRVGTLPLVPLEFRRLSFLDPPSLALLPWPAAVAERTISFALHVLAGGHRRADGADQCPPSSGPGGVPLSRDRKSTRLNSSHQIISYAV